MFAAFAAKLFNIPTPNTSQTRKDQTTTRRNSFAMLAALVTHLRSIFPLVCCCDLTKTVLIITDGGG